MKILSRTHMRLSAGLLDAGFSSLATFLIGLFAIRYLSPIALGAYAMAFSAVRLVTELSKRLLFSTLEITAVSHPLEARLRFLRHSLEIATTPTIAAGLTMAFWLLFVPSEVPFEVVRALTITGIAYATLFPIQEHVRAMLHIAEESWVAAVVSLVQLLVVFIGILTFRALQWPDWWCPFGVLAAAKISSLTVGVLLARSRERGDVWPEKPHLSEVSRLGSWLLASTMIPNAVTFLVAALVARIAGTKVLGYAEAARVVAMPLFVFALGIVAVIGPRLMSAAQTRNASSARQEARSYARIIVTVAVLYVLLVGHDWSLSPFAWLTPLAYEVPGLVVLSIFAYLVQSLSLSGGSEMLGSRQGKELVTIEAILAAPVLLIASVASFIGAYTIPLSATVQSAGRIVGYRRAMGRYYGSPEPDDGTRIAEVLSDAKTTIIS